MSSNTSKLLKGDFIRKYISGVPTHVENDPSDSIVTVTSIENLVNRSPTTSYDFTTTSDVFNPYFHTITLTFDDNLPFVECFQILNYTYGKIGISSISLKNSGGTTLTRTNETEIDTERFFDGVRKATKTYIFDSVSNVKTIEIQFVNSIPDSGEVWTIGGFYLGQVVDLDIKPTSLKYSFGTQGNKTRTEGGQIDADRNNCYMRVSFSTVATSETDVIDKHFELNYNSSVSEPIVFIPIIDESIILYGVQERPCLTVGKEAQDPETGQWMYETSFQLEEEF